MKRLKRKPISKDQPTLSSGQPSRKLLCAIYARSASAGLKGRKSIEGQIRLCKEDAVKSRSVVLDEFILADIGASGASLFARDALKSLLCAARQGPRPFDCVLVTDTARLDRNLADLLKVCEIFEGFGIFVRFVAQGLDSRVRTFRMLVTIYAMLDEEYRRALSEKVRRGKRLRVLRAPRDPVC